MTLTSEGGGSRVQVSAGRSSTLAVAGSIGFVSGCVVAGLLEPITFGVFLGGVAGGLGVALGIGIALGRRAKRRVAALMDTIGGTMARMGRWPGESGDLPGCSDSKDDLDAASSEAARKIERLQALADCRDAIGPPFTRRRVSLAVLYGAGLASVAPIALRFFPTEYPLPWLVLGVWGGLFANALLKLVRGIRVRRNLDMEIEALREEHPSGLLDLTSFEEAS